jgi:hypothetical protein
MQGMSRVSTNASSSLGVRMVTAAGLVVVVGALVLGILGMHGLGGHGAATHGNLPPVAAVTVDPHAGHAAPDRSTVTTGTIGTPLLPADGGLSSSPDDHGSSRDVVMLCAAMVLAGAVGVLLALRLQPFGRLAPLHLRAPVRGSTLPATARQGTGPPAVWEFSVVRC